MTLIAMSDSTYLMLGIAFGIVVLITMFCGMIMDSRRVIGYSLVEIIVGATISIFIASLFVLLWPILVPVTVIVSVIWLFFHKFGEIK